MQACERERGGRAGSAETLEPGQGEVWPHPRGAGDGQGGGVQPGINGRVGEGEENQAEEPRHAAARATAAQTKKVKHEIRERYAWLFGEVPLPPVEAPGAKKSERAQYESDSITEHHRDDPDGLEATGGARLRAEGAQSRRGRSSCPGIALPARCRHLAARRGRSANDGREGAMNRKQPSKKSRCDAFDEFGWHREAVADTGLLAMSVKKAARTGGWVVSCHWR